MKMLVFTVLLMSCMSVYAVGDQPNRRVNKRLEITKVALDRKSFDPSKEESVTLTFEITQEAVVVVHIYDFLENDIRTFDLGKQSTDTCSVQWDGKTNTGKQAAGEVFLYVIEAKTEDGRKVIYNPSQRTGGLSVNPQESTYNHENGVIEYVLPKACMVRIRAGLKEGMLVETVMDWVPHQAGRHQLDWNGKDRSGLFNIGWHPQLELKLTCYTLPDNTIICTGDTVDYPATPESLTFRKELNKSVWSRADKYLHYQHWPLNCHEPKFTIDFPECDIQKDSNVPVVSGRVPVRLTFSPEDAISVINKRFEVMVYVDGIFLFEVEEGSSPLTFHWNTQGLRKSEHIMTINVMTYDDHIGTLSRKVTVGD